MAKRKKWSPTKDRRKTAPSVPSPKRDKVTFPAEPLKPPAGNPEPFPSLPVPPLHLPHQPGLPELSDPALEEIEGAIDHFKGVETAVKAEIKRVSDEQNTILNAATVEVIKVFSKYNRKSIVINGKLAEVIASLKVKVKGVKKAKAEKAEASAP